MIKREKVENIWVCDHGANEQEKWFQHHLPPDHKAFQDNPAQTGPIAKRMERKTNDLQMSSTPYKSNTKSFQGLWGGVRMDTLISKQEQI